MGCAARGFISSSGAIDLPVEFVRICAGRPWTELTVSSLLRSPCKAQVYEWQLDFAVAVCVSENVRTVHDVIAGLEVH